VQATELGNQQETKRKKNKGTREPRQWVPRRADNAASTRPREAKGKRWGATNTGRTFYWVYKGTRKEDVSTNKNKQRRNPNVLDRGTTAGGRRRARFRTAKHGLQTSRGKNEKNVDCGT